AETENLVHEEFEESTAQHRYRNAVQTRVYKHMGCCHGAKPAPVAGNATTPAEAVAEATTEMVWNWSTSRATVVFGWWEVTNVLTLILSMLGVLVIAVLYEKFSHYVRKYDKSVAAAQSECSQDAVKRKG
ncbi:MAG: hypothetical protein BJ554DRAFT_6272, partial [Olpidium bornovanus]